MATNQEIKFISAGSGVPKEVLRFLSSGDEKTYLQEDIYAFSDTNFFKLRINDGVPTKLLRYRRLTSPVLRESSYDAYELLNSSAREAALFIFRSLSTAGTVRKKRRQFLARDLLLNVDTIYDDEWKTPLYHAVEVEYFRKDSSKNDTGRTVQKILDWFGVKPYELLPYSNIHMINMLRSSKQFRHVLSQGAGRLILIDGGSATGKSTVKKILVEKYSFGYAPRDTTRERRPDDLITHDYNFVSRVEFNRRALLGEYIEFRDFLFDMSYGLPWSGFIEPLSRGSNMMALINLGNGYFTKKLFPNATLVLLYADVQVIRERLEVRGTMTNEQIEERIENNRLARTYLDAYDRAIDTSKFSPQEVADQIVGC
jgi:guanylate kinase